MSICCIIKLLTNNALAQPGEKMLNITEVRIRLMEKNDTKLKAVASITIDDCFVVHDLKIIEGPDGNFIAMPSKKTPSGEYKDIAHPLNTETREALRNLILTKYEEELAQAKA